MNLVDGIEKLITEHGSAAIIGQQLPFAKDQFIALERKNSELEREVGRFHSDYRREQAKKEKLQRELEQLQKTHEEEVLIHSAIEFRKGKRTGRRWLLFCPSCHIPAKRVH